MHNGSPEMTQGRVDSNFQNLEENFRKKICFSKKKKNKKYNTFFRNLDSDGIFR